MPRKPPPPPPYTGDSEDSPIKGTTLGRFVKEHSVTKRIGEDTLILLHQALDNIVLRFVVDVGEEARRDGTTTIMDRHINAVAARTSGGAPPVPDQLVDVIDRLPTEKLADLVNLVRARLQAKQTPPTPPLPPAPPPKP